MVYSHKRKCSHESLYKANSENVLDLNFLCALKLRNLPSLSQEEKLHCEELFSKWMFECLSNNAKG